VFFDIMYSSGLDEKREAGDSLRERFLACLDLNSEEQAIALLTNGVTGLSRERCSVRF
jgi:hypothetical protein